MRFAVNKDAVKSASVFIVCGMFFAAALFLATAGSGVYQSVVSLSDSNYTKRTALSYITNQIRRGDIKNSIGVGSFGGNDAVFIFEESEYVTMIYCFDGQLRELYTSADSGLAPADGIGLMPLDSLSVEAQNECIEITAVYDGEISGTAVNPRSGFMDIGEIEYEEQ